jgi:zinc/manganese transport system permease protein
VLAVSVTLASQIVGVLLVFTLVIAPAGISLRFCRSFWSGLIASIVLGVAGVWAGILLACLTDRPPAFWITALFFGLYAIVEIYFRLLSRGSGS